MKKFKDHSTNGLSHPEIQLKLGRPQCKNQNLGILLTYSDRILNLNHLQNGGKAQKDILIRGYKYLHKVSAVGETTTKTLRAISKSRSTKFIHRFQFDP